MSSTTFDTRILKTEPVAWKSLQFIQRDDFKDLPTEARQKLKASLIGENFIDPFKVWQDPATDIIYCLDGRHRTLLLEEIESEGVSIPEKLPANFVYCDSIKDAARLVLIYSSQYARITHAGLFNFMDLHNLEFNDITEIVDLPTIDINLFEGDALRDFNEQNSELDIDEFTDEVILKFKFPKPEYLTIKGRIADKMQELAIDTPEKLLKHLLA
jgi:hypothetical protein